MRKITTFLLTLALCLVGVGGAKADNASLNDLVAAYGSTTDWLSHIPTSYPIEIKDGTIFGSDASTQTTNANLNNYDYLYVTVTNFTANKAVRIFFWDPNQNKRLDYYLKPVSEKETANYETSSNITANGTYCVKIPDGARLQGAKPAWGSSSDVSFKFSEIYLTERATPYVELVPYTLNFTPNAGSFRATIPISESHIRTTGNVSINYSTGEITNTGSGKLIIYLNNENLVGASLYHVDFSGTNLEPTLEVADAVNGEVGGIYSSRYNWNIAGDASRNKRIGAVTALRYNFTNTGSMTFTSIYIDANLLSAPTTQKDLADMPYGIWGAPANTIGDWKGTDSYKTNNINGSVNSMIYGHDGNSDAHKYVDLTNCSKITFTGLSSNGQLRLFYNWSGTDSDKPIEIIEDFPTSSDTYVFDIDAFKKAKNITFFHLNGIKAAMGGSATISAVTVDEYDNVITGTGIDKTQTYLSNPYVTFIDATGVSGTGVTLTSANPNCIFKANSGALANTKNVMVGTTIANLDITDGHPFAAPADATATAATYTRTMTNQFGTICLPYAVSSSETTKYYTLGALSGDVLTLTAVDNLAAGTPAIVEKVSGSSITAAGAGALADVQAPGAGALQLYGTYDAKTILASDYEGKSIYAIANNQFVQATNSINLPAFRAYFVSTPASANIRFGFDEGEDATAINALTGEGDVTIESIYSADGAQQSSLQKGMNVVKLSNGEVKKIFVK